MRSAEKIAAEIEGLVAKATPEPWFREEGWDVVHQGTNASTFFISSIADCGNARDQGDRRLSREQAQANAALIARAPTLLAEAARALRARPGREEVELVLRELVGSCEKAAADERNRQIFNVPSMGSSLDRDEMIRASLRDLGFGQEGEG